MKKYFFTLLLAALICAPVSLSAQVTVGSGNEPSQWSLLDLDNSARVSNNEQPKALHLPRMTQQERIDLALNNYQDLAQGLLIFNTTYNCVEFWSGTQWISLCKDDPN